MLVDLLQLQMLTLNIHVDRVKYHRHNNRKHVSGVFVLQLFVREPEERLGVKGNIRMHNFFSSTDWNALEQRQVVPPFRPTLVSTFTADAQQHFCFPKAYASCRYLSTIDDLKWRKHSAVKVQSLSLSRDNAQKTPLSLHKTRDFTNRYSLPIVPEQVRVIN